MRLPVLPALLSACLLPLAHPAAAQAPDCAAQAEIVMQAVTARAEGRPKSEAVAGLSAALDAEAASMLSDWIWTLPEDQLTSAVGEAWQTQCEAL
ncbi:hypothetical protein [Pseudoponticoccus marisrubri]|uniref:DNA primase n=1 Tax=Pseudoponticoccus marisrubri TaxID=1685382 RepID=A0A0W7WF65_9RHOB|nr:hypothetical protein [Pseudoponticoccus marisrubri]KUF09260.1 hypothetical protein AVJ23_18575 [Pseudoponticoccus marisrubri]